jgi:outer membrane protein assembly factor BamB
LGSGNYATSLYVGSSVLYASVGGNTRALTALNLSTGAFKWSLPCVASPTTPNRYTEAATSKTVLFFCDGSRFRAGYENGTSFEEFLWSPLNIDGVGSSPSRSFSPDGSGDLVYAYFNTDAGKVYKVKVKTGEIMWTTPNISTSSRSTTLSLSDRIYTGCTTGDILQLDPATGDIVASRNMGDSINTPFAYASAGPTLYCTPKGQTVYSLASNLSSIRWSYNTGANLSVGVNYYSVAPAGIYVPAGDSLIGLRDDATVGTRLFGYAALGPITTMPVSASGVTYFSATDNRLYAVNRTTGVSMVSWPSAVLAGPNRSRVVYDGVTTGVFFGGGDGKIYRFPRQ